MTMPIDFNTWRSMRRIHSASGVHVETSWHRGLPSASTIARQYAPHPARWIFNIAKIAGNQVNMHVHSRLPCCLPDIYPDVVTVGRMFGLDVLLRLAKKLNDRELLRMGHFEEVGHMALR